MRPFIAHNVNADIERYTPPEITAAARETLGAIDLDPCTTLLVNGTFIRAKKVYTKATDGLNRDNPWTGRVYVNPPGYITHTDGSDVRNGARLFWERLMVEYSAGHVTAGVFLAYNLEQLQQSQRWNYSLLQWPFCIPERRLTFYWEKNGIIQTRDHAEFSNAIVYVGRSVRRFATAFGTIGTVIIPRIASCPVKTVEEVQQAAKTIINADEACRIATEAESRQETTRETYETSTG